MFSRFLTSLHHGEEKALAKVFWLFLGVHILFWTIAPHFFIPYWRIDTPEMIVAGNHWLLCTYKHPGLQGWVVEILSDVLGSIDYAPYLAAQLAVALAVWCVWRLGREFLSPTLALVGALAMLTYLYFNYESAQYNNRSFMKAFMALAIYWTWLAFKTDKIIYWAAVGVALAAGIYCKMTTFLLIFAIVSFMLLDSGARRYWRKPGPYVTTAVCFVLFCPLLVWLIKNQFAPFFYAQGSLTRSEYSVWGHLFWPVRFLGSQFIVILPILLCMIPTLGIGWKWNRKRFWGTETKDRFLTYMTLFPLLFTLAITVVDGHKIRGALGDQIWLFFPIFLLYTAERTRADWVALRRSLISVASVMVFMATVSVLLVYYAPKIKGEASRMHYPGQELARQVTQVWETHFDKPLVYVCGDDWAGMAVEIYGEEYEKLDGEEDGDIPPQICSPQWCNTEDFRKTGGVLLWNMSDHWKVGRMVNNFNSMDFRADFKDGLGPVTGWLAQFPNRIDLKPLVLRAQTRFNVPPIVVGIALIPPEKETIMEMKIPTEKETVTEIDSIMEMENIKKIKGITEIEGVTEMNEEQEKSELQEKT
ncbi:MAG: glycosyltransferase family 39 protein [Planctomycetia bacterium]|nr:glycosyltransferase family 39 protein [Planctomycetia bacterium]